MKNMAFNLTILLGCALSSSAFAAPDLQITDLDVQISKSSALVEVTVVNKGKSTSKGTWIDVYQGNLDRFAKGAYGDDYAHLPSLKSGESVKVAFDATDQTYVILDLDGLSGDAVLDHNLAVVSGAQEAWDRYDLYRPPIFECDIDELTFNRGLEEQARERGLPAGDQDGDDFTHYRVRSCRRVR